MKKKLLFLSLALLTIFTFVACGGNNQPATNTNQPANTEKTESAESAGGATIDKIKEKGKLVLGTSADYPPYEFKTLVNGKLEIVGFDIEIAKLLAQDLGVELEVKDMDFKLLIESLKQGEVDIVLAGLSPTEERKKEIGMTESYYTSEQTVVIRKEDAEKIKTLDDLKGLTLGAQMGAIQVDLAKSVENAKVKELPLVTALIADLKTKALDAVVMEKAVAKQYADANEDLLMPDFIFENNDKGSAVGVKIENTDLVDHLNKKLDELKKDGTIEKLVAEAIQLSENQSNN